jgi:recombination protein RecT
MMCCLDFSYRGLASLAIDTGAVLDMDATAVHKEDFFSYEMGLEPKLVHKPSMEQDAGATTHVYAIAILKNGIRKFIVLTKAEVEKVRQSSQAPNSPMWKGWWDEGARKTAIKKLYKLLPQNEKMSEAIEIINKHEGIDFDAKPESELEKRLNNSKDITPKVEPEGATGTDSHSGKGTPSAGGEGMKFAQGYPPSVNEEKTTISPEEAEAIHQRELKEAGLKPEETKQQTAQNIKDKPYIKPKESGGLF